MKNMSGFSLVELVIFIVVTGILASTLLLTFRTTLVKIPNVHYTIIATQLADQCMEGFIGERKLLGYTSANLACSGSPTLPAVCTVPSGYTLAATITCTPTLSGDSVTSRTITVTVSGLGSATLNTLIASY